MAKGRGLWSRNTVPRLSERNIEGIRYRKSEFEIFEKTCGTYDDIQSIKCTYQRAQGICDDKHLETELQYVKQVLRDNKFRVPRPHHSERVKPATVERVPAVLSFMKGVTDKISLILKEIDEQQLQQLIGKLSCELVFDEKFSVDCRDGMGCIPSSQRVDVITMSTSEGSWQNANGKETVLAALVRLDQDITNSEKLYPAQKLAVVSAELESIQQEIKNFEEITSPTNLESYAKTMHQIFVNLDLYRRPILATENEDFVANVNRKEMRKLELNWLRVREKELQSERRGLHAQLLRIRSLYQQLQQLLSCIWTDNERPGTSLEGACERARALRDALASVSARLRASAESVHSALRLLDDALPVWKLAAMGKSGWERTRACSDACRLLVHARCSERNARRVLVATAAPRAARALRLALDYAFTDTLHDHKYKRATEAFVQFKEALVQLVSSIHQVLLNNVENLAMAEKDLQEKRRQLRAARVNDIVKRGLADLHYESSALASLKQKAKE